MIYIIPQGLINAISRHSTSSRRDNELSEQPYGDRKPGTKRARKLLCALALRTAGFTGTSAAKEDLFAAAFEQGLKQLAHYADSAVKHAPKGGELKTLIDIT